MVRRRGTASAAKPAAKALPTEDWRDRTRWPRLVLVHYHEIALKGRNRPRFVAQLVRNIERAVSDLAVGRVVALPGRLVLPLGAEEAWPEVRARLADVLGIANYALAYRVRPEMDELESEVLRRLADRRFGSFRILTRRADKRFALSSMDVDRRLGERVRLASGARVDLGAPELTVYVEILPHDIVFYFDKLPGPRGVPVGTGGTVVSLLSGGIDSPVAAYRMIKRGCRVVFVHFHSVPFLSRASQEKVKEIVERLTRYQYRSELLLVPFGEIQRRIMLGAPAPLRVVLYRRSMIRIAAAIAARRGALALVTGESLGQVASQTLDNLAAIDRVAPLPVLRPLIGMDKDEITAEAKTLETYEISIQPDQDCCQLFIPPHPATRCRPEEAERAEGRVDFGELLDEAVRSAERLRFAFPPDAGEAPSPRED